MQHLWTNEEKGTKVITIDGFSKPISRLATEKEERWYRVFKNMIFINLWLSVTSLHNLKNWCSAYRWVHWARIKLPTQYSYEHKTINWSDCNLIKQYEPVCEQNLFLNSLLETAHNTDVHAQIAIINIKNGVYHICVCVICERTNTLKLCKFLYYTIRSAWYIFCVCLQHLFFKQYFK